MPETIINYFIKNSNIKMETFVLFVTAAGFSEFEILN